MSFSGGPARPLPAARGSHGAQCARRSGELEVFGGPGVIPDVVLTVASDDRGRAREASRSVERDTSEGPRNDGRRRERAEAHFRPAWRYASGRGHEHFGFKDGISQPGSPGSPVRRSGRFPDAPIRRPRSPSGQAAGGSRQRARLSGPVRVRLRAAGPERRRGRALRSGVVPAWARNGLYLVIRRLRQDVRAFRETIARQARALARKPGFAGTTAAGLAAKLVGRWSSGAPVVRSPQADDEALGKNDFANNHFAFQNAYTSVPLRRTRHLTSRTVSRRRPQIISARLARTRRTSGR